MEPRKCFKARIKGKQSCRHCPQSRPTIASYHYKYQKFLETMKFIAIATFVAAATQLVLADTTTTDNQAGNRGHGGHGRGNCVDLCYRNWEPCAAGLYSKRVGDCWTCCYDNGGNGGNWNHGGHGGKGW
ncbi:hypothetical protein D9756_001099 [Leucocoprinus leucothites]|uniref:Uncharacterized protein n=1 Tax=Leucocoprinus leucothites TaxID=201217 RepID=A0A8H5GE58_9AGAR|nr:hypothetical protein D9756_001099 [Leucoagaricus leucothites]